MSSSPGSRLLVAGCRRRRRRAASATSMAATFTVVEHATTDAVTDTGKKGDTAGDLLTFANKLYNAGNTTKVGSDNGYCVPNRGRQVLGVLVDRVSRRRASRRRGTIPRCWPEQACDHRRHRQVRTRARVDESQRTERQGNGVRLHVPRSGLKSSGAPLRLRPASSPQAPRSSSRSRAVCGTFDSGCS